MKISDIDNTLTFKNIHLSGGHGQDEFALRLMRDSVTVGEISYTVYDGEVSVNMIDVYAQRKGHGKRLLRYLQSLYPTQEINFGYTTEEGTALINSLDYSTQKSPHYDDFKKLTSMRQQLKAKMDNKEFDDIDDLRDDIDDLESTLWGKSPYIKLIK